MSLGLALSGGGIKGAAHIGVIKALEENNIKIDYISGTSSGSLIATMYAMGYTPDEMYNLFKKYSKKIGYISLFNIIKLIYGIIFKRKIIIKSINNGKKLKKIIEKICLDKKITNINQIKMPLLIPSVDLNTGTVCIFSSKDYRSSYSDKIIYNSNINICNAIYASCSYPGVFEPICYKNMYLIDGGIRENIPWKETQKLGADKVLSVIFKSDIPNPNERNVLNIITDSIGLLSHELANYEIEGTNYLIQIPTENIGLLNFKEVDTLFNLGYNTTMNKIKKGNIEKLLIN